MACSVSGCEKPARKLNLCWGHHKRMRRGLPVHVPLREHESLTPHEELMRAALRYADAEADEEYELRKTLLFRAALKLRPRNSDVERPAPIQARRHRQPTADALQAAFAF